MSSKVSKNQIDPATRERINGALFRLPRPAIPAPHPLALPLHTKVRLPALGEPEQEKQLAAMNTDELLPVAFDRNWPTVQRAYKSARTLTELNRLLGADEAFYEWACRTGDDPFAIFGEVQSNVYRGYFRHHQGIVCTSTRELNAQLQQVALPNRGQLTRLSLPARALFVCFGIGEWAFPWSDAPRNPRAIDGAYVLASSTKGAKHVSLGFTTRGSSFLDSSMIELPPMELREDAGGQVLIEIDAPNVDELYENRWVNLAIDHVLKILLHVPEAQTQIAVAGVGEGVAGRSVRPEDRQYAWMIVGKA